MSELKLSVRQLRVLREQLERPDSAVAYRRALALLELHEGRSVAELARLLRVSRQTIYNWKETYFRRPERATLSDAPRSGRPPEWTDQTQQWLEASLKYPPDEWGYQAVSWTVPLLCEQLALCCGQRFSPSTMRLKLRQSNYVWKRPRYVLEPDPQREKKTTDSQTTAGIASRNDRPL